ncbi:hypothetical protein [Methylophilus aquaticus]|uniref:Uncharacterized protein n=1 Tax=Methylophilus aquaticus TaxID=1971610 RepID=A0ABT9JUE7_9PROT|nr:hypothetical protein [Methylophilus aquaticus]MDP8567730.1 hypothetical protein [Methylophilus aquaticus]
MQQNDNKVSQQSISAWSDLNVQTFTTPEQLTLFNFVVDWPKISGTFQIKLDAFALAESFSFAIDQSGKANFYLPMFHSPLGVPASYASVKFTDETSCAILKGLRSVLPRLRGLGVDSVTGLEITYSTPIHDRIIDKDVFDAAKLNLSRSDFNVTIQLS